MNILRCIWDEFTYRSLNLLVAIDQLCYVLITLGKGHPDETMSSAAWYGSQNGQLLPRFFRPIIDFIFSPFEKDHCRKAFEAEINNLQLPKGYDDARSC